MSEDATPNVIVPSSPKDRQALKLMIVDITNQYALIDGHKEVIKESLSAAEEKYGVKKKLVAKIARAMYKQSYKDIVQENEDFDLLYQTLVESKKVETKADEE